MAMSFTTDVSLPLAFGAGFLSFFTPCLLPMIPAYIMYITGVNMEDELNKRRLLALVRTLGFVIGFTIIFMIMGSSATFLGQIFIRNRLIFSRISGIVIIIFGLHLMSILNLSILNFRARGKAPKKISNWFSSVLMGMVFAAGWTPCFGPVLGAILMYASGADTVSNGMSLLFVYSLKMAIPFILTALFINVFIKFMNKADKLMTILPKIGGAIMVVFGLLVFFDKVIVISNMLL